ncbi:uncharacterized protein LOC134259367 [Saccostrea cucullata]|uniref:uncharacterized protein LOC134259367 n=1 Tax=Saccostrea cuccullata TaxID=36930 RepID=UPI002ED3BDA2
MPGKVPVYFARALSSRMNSVKLPVKTAHNSTDVTTQKRQRATICIKMIERLATQTLIKECFLTGNARNHAGAIQIVVDLVMSAITIPDIATPFPGVIQIIMRALISLAFHGNVILR